ncbi:tetratricopeptide repeat protein, partial [bacterium]|nr:tetratricopeptide repeat protein [bacterium]
MIKKVLVTALVLFGLVFSVTAEDCFADAAALLEQARQAKMQRHFDEAEVIYRQIIAECPGTVEAMQAQKWIVIIYIKEKRYADSQQELTKLIENFPQAAGLPGCLYEIARKYEAGEKFDLAKPVYEQIIQKYPNSRDSSDNILYADKGRVDLQKCRIRIILLRLKSNTEVSESDIQEAQTATDELINSFGDNPYLPEVLYKIAKRYDELGKRKPPGEGQIYHTKAKEIYQRIIHQDYTDASIAKHTQILLLIEAGSYTEAQSATDKFISDFGNNPYTANVLYSIARKYHISAKEYDRAKG